jgi:hypothetical protein
MEVSGQLHALAALTPGRAPGTHWIGGWMGLKASLDVVGKKKNPCWELNPSCPASSLVTTITDLS